MSIKSKIVNVSPGLVARKIKSKIDDYKYRDKAHQTTFDWRWKEKGHNRIALVNFLVSMTGGINCNYLEIGCQSNDLFDSVISLKKTGVDPEAGGTHRMTSDEFFSANTDHFDVIFIDGLHEYDQVRRDALNSLETISQHGWIAFHDFLPSNWKEQHVPRISNAWTGDCWKLAVELSQAEGIEFYILEIDHGVGLLRKTSETYNIPDLSDELANADFDRFISVMESLPIIEYKQSVDFIAATTDGRQT